jgi:hypothetical protein
LFLWILFEPLDFFLHLFEVRFSSLVLWVELERLFIMGLRILQFSQRFLVRFSAVASLLQRSTAVIMTFLLERFVLGKQRTAEPFQRFVEISHLVGGRARIELNLIGGMRVRVIL